MEIESVQIADLKQAEVVVRKHPEEQIKELCRSVKKFGQTRPIIVDEDNVVLAGNGLLTAFLEMRETEIKAYRVKGLSKEEKYKLMIADNKIFSLGYDDYSVIKDVLKGFSDFDVPGFDDSFLKELTNGFDQLTIPELEKTDNFMKQQNMKVKVNRKGEKTLLCPKCGEVIST